jgi:hypothetical protein
MVNISNINPNTLTLQNISPEDVSIIPNTTITSSFSPVDSRVEYFIYDFNDTLLSSNPDLRSYKPVQITAEGNIVDMTLVPEFDAVNAGYDTGIVKTIYNFVTPELNSENDTLFISEISPSRTEVRLSSNTNPLFNTVGVDAATFISSSNYDLYNTFRQNVETNNYFDEFYLNFGNNIYVVGVNSLLEFDSQNNTISLLIKLYEPLPTNISTKTELYIVTKNAESVAYQIEFVQENLFQDSTIKLTGPNYNIPLKDETGPLTQYKNYDDILSTTLSGSLFQLINNISSSSPQLSVDYANYEDFIFFSSAYQRLYNFKEKVINISSSQAQLNLLYSNVTGPTVNTPAISSSKLLLESEIQTIIASFDGYENFLYYTSGTYAWPKSNTTAPYVLYPPTSSQATTWYNNQSATSSEYDENNQNNLDYVVPEYLRYNPSNTNYMLFVNLIGQFFDEMWLYTKAITSKLDANSNLYEGVSKDLVATVLESLGTKIYDSTYTLENIYSSLIGLSANGSLYPTTGSALITNYVTASVANTEDIPTIDDFIKLSYKKIYHNLPYLLKKKGTNAGLKALINIFGIPDTILQINEFGGKNKVGNNDWDYWQDKFNYKLDIEAIDSQYVEIPWEVNSLWNSPDNVPSTVQFRFKTPGLNSALSSPSQSLWNLDDTGNTAIVLEYTGSGYTTGSYSGSITSSFNEYATLKFIPNYSDDPTVSASIYLPFFNGDWWSVMATREGGNFYLYAANKIYNGDDGFIIGYTGSATASADVAAWISGTNSYFGSNNNLTIGPKTYNNFSGSYQEVRYYNTLIPSGTFYDYTMNPYSIEGVGINGAYDQLMFRGTLGNDLYTASKSMHPKITGSYITQSFASNSNFTINSGSFSVNREWTFQDQIPAGVRNTVSKKIKNISTILPYSGSEEVNLPQNTTLSPFIYIDQDSYNSSSYVADVDYVEVAFSPQNEINEDINAQIGYFNIGEYIGDPRQVSSSEESYPELDVLRDAYFQKYYANYNLWDYIRIIRYYDNALFKMIKDYVPVRSSLTTGVVIKQHILERNKYPVPQADISTPIAVVGEIPTTESWLNVILDQFNTQVFYPITASSVYGLTVTGSVEDDGSGGLYEVFLQIPSLSNTFFYIDNIAPNATFTFSGSYTGFIPSGSSLAIVSDGGFDFFVQNLTASLLLTNPYYAPYYTEDMLITGSPIQMYEITGSTGGTMPDLFGLTSSQYTGNGVVNITQSWTGVTPSLLGPVYFTDATQVEFFNGELSGSTIIVETGSLSDCEVEIIEIYSTSSIFNGNGISSSITYNSANALQRDVDIDKTYYISFTATNSAGALASASATLYDNSGRIFYSGLTSSAPNQPGPGQSININQIQISNPLFPLYFSSATGVNTATVTNITLFEDFIDQDCQVIYNDIQVSRPNPKFWDVDFSSNSVTAVNEINIISASRGTGSATPSTTPESNYTTARSANPRYNGSKNTSPDFNVGYSNNVPSVESDHTYFAYFSWLGGTTPEIIPKTAFNIKYLIDDSGNISTPNLSSSYYDNLLRTFNENNKANVIFLPESTSGNISPLKGTKSVIKAGALAQAIIFSQTGSISAQALTTMSFSSTVSTINFNLQATIGTDDYTNPGTFNILDISSPTTSGSTATTASFTGDFVAVRTSDPEPQIIPKVYLDVTYFDSVNNYTASADFFIQKSVDSGASWSTVYSTSSTLISGDSYQYNITSIPDTPISGSRYRAGINYDLTGGSPYTSDPHFQINDGKFYLTQTPPFNSQVTSSFWFTGSTSPSTLTGSQFNSDIYGISYQNEVTGSGYDYPYQLFTVQRGDIIRFAASENQSYLVINVSAPSQNANNILYLTLDRPVVAGTNLNSFLIKRYVPNANIVILDADKTVSVGNGAGFLMPEYASQTLSDKFDSIVQDLTAKGII